MALLRSLILHCDCSANKHALIHGSSSASPRFAVQPKSNGQNQRKRQLRTVHQAKRKPLSVAIRPLHIYIYIYTQAGLKRLLRDIHSLEPGQERPLQQALLFSPSLSKSAHTRASPAKYLSESHITPSIGGPVAGLRVNRPELSKRFLLSLLV